MCVFISFHFALTRHVPHPRATHMMDLILLISLQILPLSSPMTCAANNIERTQERHHRGGSDGSSGGSNSGRSERIKRRFLSSSALMEQHRFMLVSWLASPTKNTLPTHAICVSLSRYTCCKCQYKYSDEANIHGFFMFVLRYDRVGPPPPRQRILVIGVVGVVVAVVVVHVYCSKKLKRNCQLTATECEHANT